MNFCEDSIAFNLLNSIIIKRKRTRGQKATKMFIEFIININPKQQLCRLPSYIGISAQRNTKRIHKILL